jgi:hypothetical protein
MRSFITLYLYSINSVERSPPWGANSCSVTHNIHSILKKVKVHCCVHKHLSLIHILSHIYPVYTLQSYSFKIYFNIIFPSTYWSLPLPFNTGHSTKIFHAHIFPSMLVYIWGDQGILNGLDSFG